ncbi:hypothetical protein L7F22_035224 [Adiantum nelumboides]|nr:hypothetical protein [Adiantum nelumboides]
MDMAKFHACTAWKPNGTLCTLPSNSRTASPRPSSLSYFFSADFPSFSSSFLPVGGRCWRLSSIRSRRVCRILAVGFSPDFYHIPYTEGVPVGSKLKLYNLPHNCDPEDLITHFRSCNAVVQSLEITNNTEEEGNASGYVVLEDLNQACAAVAQLDGAKFQGKCVRMDFVERRPYEDRDPNRLRRRKKRTHSTNQVYIGNLPWRVDSTTLKQLFSIHGTVHQAEVMRDRLNGRSRGYGFVVMSTAAEVHKAIAALDGCEIEGRPLKVNVAMMRAPLGMSV